MRLATPVKRSSAREGLPGTPRPSNDLGVQTEISTARKEKRSCLYDRWCFVSVQPDHL